MSRRLSSSVLVVTVALVAILGVTAAVHAPPAFACSCAMRESIEDYADAQTVIVAGTVGASEAAGVRFTVGQWFWGANAAPVVWLDHQSFGIGGGDCTIPQFAAGQQLLIVGYRNRPVDPLNTGACSPSYDLGTPDGQRQLADARRAFGGLAPPADPGDPTAEPVAATGAAEDRRAATLTAIAAALLAVVAILFLGVAVAARRRRGARTS